MTAAPATAAAPSSRRGPGRPRLAPYLFILPFFIVFGTFGLYALLNSFGLSFTSWRGVRGGEFIGLDNYLNLLGDNSFRRALFNTAGVWLLTVPVLSFGGLALAWMLQSKLVRFRGVFRAVFFLPVLPSLVVVGITFLLLLDPQYGLPNLLLRQLGLAPISLKTDPLVAVPVLSLVVIWRWLGFNMVIQLAGLQALSDEPIESARIDGASEWQVFWRVVVPMSKPVLLFSFINSTIGTFNLFDEAYMLFGTQGGPGEAGLVVGTFIFRDAFEFFRLGYASAAAYAVAVLVFIASVVQLRVARDAS